ncbi:transcriptional regulator, partial [Sinorhizobium meliloti]
EFASSDVGLALIRAFSQITDKRVRDRILGLVKALAKQDPA